MDRQLYSILLFPVMFIQLCSAIFMLVLGVKIRVKNKNRDLIERLST